MKQVDLRRFLKHAAKDSQSCGGSTPNIVMIANHFLIEQPFDSCVKHPDRLPNQRRSRILQGARSTSKPLTGRSGKRFRIPVCCNFTVDFPAVPASEAATMPLRHEGAPRKSRIKK